MPTLSMLEHEAPDEGPNGLAPGASANGIGSALLYSNSALSIGSAGLIAGSNGILTNNATIRGIFGPNGSIVGIVGANGTIVGANGTIVGNVASVAKGVHHEQSRQYEGDPMRQPPSYS